MKASFQEATFFNFNFNFSEERVYFWIGYKASQREARAGTEAGTFRSACLPFHTALPLTKEFLIKPEKYPKNNRGFCFFTP